MSPRWAMPAAVFLALLIAAALLYARGLQTGAARERLKAEAALAQAAGAKLEARGERESASRADAAVRQGAAAARIVSDAAAKALKSEDAHAPLDVERAARLRAADRELCLANPGLDGCAADRHAG